MAFITMLGTIPATLTKPESGCAAGKMAVDFDLLGHFEYEVAKCVETREGSLASICTS
jgi:hypothetical protein